MARFGSSIVYGDLKVTGKIIGDGAGGAGGITKNAEDLAIANITTDTGVVGGKEYQYQTVANTAANNLIVASFEDLIYGAYSVMLRMFVSNISSTANLIKIESYHVVGATETLLNTAYIKPSNFTTANWETFGFVTEFKGTSGTSAPILRIKISVVSNPVAAVIAYDYMRISPTYTTIFSLPTT